MPVTAQTLVDEILNEGTVDATSSQALSWLDRRHKKMVARSLCLKTRLDVGTTVAGTAEYPLSVIELYSLEVAGAPYGKARRPDLYAASQGNLVWESSSGGGGLIVADADGSGVTGISLIPTPTTSGDAITAFAAMPAPDLALTDPLLVDADFYDALVEGALATALARIDEQIAAADRYEMRFDQACEEQRVRAARRFRGPGPAQIRVQGINA